MDVSLAPGLLVAAPSMDDTRFERTVILLAEAGSGGALGFVLNRNTPYTFGDLADDIGFDLAPEIEPASVHYGGPVSPERGWILFWQHLATLDEEDESIESVLHVTPEIHLAATLEVLGDFVTARNSAPFKLLLGYAGWAPNQLEEEIQDGSWIPVALDSELLFNVPNDDLWRVALSKVGLEAGMFVMGKAGGTA